ncbi:alpha/beta hydrolase [Actinoallomurus bryophytorum]|uniref:Acetyl esterase/lipase n=1 Tax=Actinoallomurus bryophytorum TaxID=1490222 RepID=A0A543CNJ4_9ACTN|nr:alpha/beta hydrolase [Actinoallomurus bryophytorum]TQL98669.1 acetyl esterase/lipase [Actinoallomurus bryophytorum]
MPSKQSQTVKELYRGWTRAMIESREPDIDGWGDLTAEPRGVDYLETDAGGVPAMWAVPKGCAEDRVLLCLHGGGFMSGSMYTHRKLYAHLAKAAGVRALILEYRLAPGHLHPAQVDDATDAYAWLLGQGVGARHIAFAGDSAGGGLAITTMLRARERGLPLPAASMPLSPWVDMEVLGGSYESNRDKDAFFYREVVQALADLFLGTDGDPRDPLANPLHADLTGLPPVYIQAGGDETLVDDAHLLEEHARKAGMEVRLDVFPGQQHSFQMTAGRAPEADEAIRSLAAWVRPRLGL